MIVHLALAELIYTGIVLLAVGYLLALFLPGCHAFGRFVRNLLTEDDADRNWCLARVLSCIAVLAYIAIAGTQTLLAPTALNLAAFGGGLAALLTASGGAIRLKGDL